MALSLATNVEPGRTCRCTYFSASSTTPGLGLPGWSFKHWQELVWSFGLWHYTVLKMHFEMDTDVSEEHAASNFILTWGWWKHIPLKQWYPPTRLHSVAPWDQNLNIQNCQKSVTCSYTHKCSSENL
jgi:hypothetical protein